MVNQLPIGVTYSHVVAKSIRENQIEDSFFSLVAKICIFFPDVPSSKTQKTGNENHELPPLGLPLSQIILLSHAQTSGWRYKSRNICLELST